MTLWPSSPQHRRAAAWSGGRYDQVISGNMIAGSARVAGLPADDKTGVMTFLISRLDDPLSQIPVPATYGKPGGISLVVEGILRLCQGYPAIGWVGGGLGSSVAALHPSAHRADGYPARRYPSGARAI